MDLNSLGCAGLETSWEFGNYVPEFSVSLLLEPIKVRTLKWKPRVWSRSSIRSLRTSLPSCKSSCRDGFCRWRWKWWLRKLVIDFRTSARFGTFTCIYETLKANQFCTRLKIKLIREEEFNLMFNFARRLCCSTKLLCWESNLPFKNPRILECEKKRWRIHLPKTQDLKRQV